MTNLKSVYDEFKIRFRQACIKAEQGLRHTDLRSKRSIVVKIKEFPILVCRDDDEEASLPSSGDEMSSLARPVDPNPLHQQVNGRAISAAPTRDPRSSLSSSFDDRRFSSIK